MVAQNRSMSQKTVAFCWLGTKYINLFLKFINFSQKFTILKTKIYPFFNNSFLNDFIFQLVSKKLAQIQEEVRQRDRKEYGAYYGFKFTIKFMFYQLYIFEGRLMKTNI